MMEETLLNAAEAFALPYYQEPARAYHNTAHVRSMLEALEVRGVLTVPLALAVWGHDLIYDARAGDNEERSAAAFDRWLASREAASGLRAEVRALILATKHVAPPATRAAALLVDADLAILGASPANFAAYDAAIRQEYSHVPALLYRGGRKRVLRGFLDRDRIYTTPEFAALEEQARANLSGAVGRR
ncbi:HD domain-containing protein [Deinococcus arenicola]|uniref:Phosphohydrolase n=1 Tax=Deinococcus arenicola TaxID=2994950 RepID=A0ABU4DL00_9DEIO|nr:phosphohydrolase [Deinococcus sp. ZS9-10]MDV6373113.1 phosphohydrolase [Deinococcus sp. ZS9-10]